MTVVPVLFLHRIQLVVHVIRRHPLDGLAGAATEGIIGKAGSKAARHNARELVPDVPGVGGRDSGVSHRGQIAIQIVRLGGTVEHRLLVVGVVRRGGEDRREPRSGPGSTLDLAVATDIVTVGQRAEYRCALLIGETGQLVGCVITVVEAIAIGIDHRRTAVSVVVHERHRTGPLGHLRQAVGVVVGVGHSQLPGHRHRGSAARIVVGIVDLADGKGIREILIEGIGPLLGLERTEFETIGRNTGRMGRIGKGAGGHDPIAVEMRSPCIETECLLRRWIRRIFGT